MGSKYIEDINMQLQELIKAFLEIYTQYDPIQAQEKLEKYWQSIDFTNSEDPYEVAADAASSSYFTEY